MFQFANAKHIFGKPLTLSPAFPAIYYVIEFERGESVVALAAAAGRVGV